jgi:hypothetical protein
MMLAFRLYASVAGKHLKFEYSHLPCNSGASHVSADKNDEQILQLLSGWCIAAEGLNVGRIVGMCGADVPTGKVGVWVASTPPGSSHMCAAHVSFSGSQLHPMEL